MIAGVIPNYVKEEKIAVLVEAGMNRLRMGIQNGSWNILQFYDRPTPPKRVLEAAETISKFRKYMACSRLAGTITSVFIGNRESPGHSWG